MLRLAVLVSGSGSNLQALFDRFRGDSRVEIVLVVGSRPGIRALDRAEREGVASAVAPSDRSEAEAWLAATLRDSGADLVILAGYTRLVPASVVEAWRGRMLNIHPALLPAFGGPGMYGRRVHEAVLESGVRTTGVTVHLVDESYDTGAIVAQEPVPVMEFDDPDSLAARVLETEHKLLPAVVAAVAEGRCILGVESARWVEPPSLQSPQTKET